MIDELHQADDDAAGVPVFRGDPPHIDEFYSRSSGRWFTEVRAVELLAAERGKIDPPTSGLSRGAQDERGSPRCSTTT